MDEQKRIYSLNKLAYLLALGANVQILFDENKKLYGISNDDQLKIYLQQYREDAQLHDFIDIYSNLRRIIHNNKTNQ